MKKIILSALLIVFCVWCLYDQTGAFEFLRLDDHDYTFRCWFVKDGLSLANLKAAFTTWSHAGVWMPATYISYMTDISLFGMVYPGDVVRLREAMGPHHLVNVALHSLNAVLLFGLLLGMMKRMGGGETRKSWVLVPLLATLFWALHPQRVEAVAWIAGRKDVLCGTFTLAGLLCWLRPTWGGRLGAMGCGILACLSKPTAMGYPLLLLAMEVMLGRVSCAGIYPRELNSRAQNSRAHHLSAIPKRDIIAYGVTLAMGIFTGAVAIFSQTHAEGHLIRELYTASLPWRVFNALVAVGLDLSQLVVPVGLHLDYRAVPGQLPLHWVEGLVVLLLVVGGIAWGAWKYPKARRVMVALGIFFFAMLGPTLGIFGSFGEHARADRFLYLPMLAVSMAVIWWHPPRKRLVGTVGAALVLGVAALAWPLVASYRNDHTAFSRTLECDPEHGRALAHVASEECARFNHIDKGIELYRRSQAVRPRDDTASQLAYTLMLRARREDHAEIRQLCSKFACDHALDRKGQALEALGTIAMRERRWKEAVGCLEDSIKAPARFYSAEDAFLHLACCYTNVNRGEDAIAILERLTQSRRNDIAGKASQGLQMLKANPRAALFF